MHFVARMLLSLVIFCVIGSVVIKTANAEGEFETSYEVTYAIDNNGSTTGTYNITIENKTPNYYADKFELKIGSTKVTEVSARDSTGELQTEIKFENNVTAISTKFNQRVIGLGKTLSWNLTYKTNDIAIKSGQIWEISIPKIADVKETKKYDLEVIIPKSLGQNAFAIPKAKEQSETTQDYLFIYEKEQLTQSGIALGFGDKQVFSINLTYFLENTNVTSQTMDIALPPDNNYQQVVLSKIDPPPADVTVDKDGNFLANYKLKPKEIIEVNVSGYVEVFSKPFRKITKTLSDADRELFTQPQRYWEVDNTQIREKAQQLKTPEAIYEYITKSFKYNSDRLTGGRLERKGAVAAISDPENLVCMEFTDLFIALSRAVQIPAREIEGYAYTQNDRLRPLSLNLYDGDILHAWPEYWDDEKGWIQIDPTWATTSGGLDYFNKMDFNHITFVQKGLSSIEPHPAGAYKTKDTSSNKTVYVQFAQDLPDTKPGAEIRIDTPKRIISSLPLNFKVNVLNTASTSIIGEKLFVNAVNLNGENQKEEEITILPPFSKKSFEFNFPTKGFLSSKLITISALYASTSAAKDIKIKPFYMLLTDPIFIVTFVIVSSVVILGLRFYKKNHAFPKFKLAKSSTNK